MFCLSFLSGKAFIAEQVFIATNIYVMKWPIPTAHAKKQSIHES